MMQMNKLLLTCALEGSYYSKINKEFWQMNKKYLKIFSILIAITIILSFSIGCAPATQVPPSASTILDCGIIWSPCLRDMPTWKWISSTLARGLHSNMVRGVTWMQLWYTTRMPRTSSLLKVTESTEV